MLKEQDWKVDPAVWDKDWGMHIQPAGSGASALKYLGAYLARTAISDSRIIVNVSNQSVSFHWNNRKHGTDGCRRGFGLLFPERI